MPTPKTEVRLSEAYRRKIEAIRARYGLESDAEAIRYALNEAHRRILLEPAAGQSEPRPKPNARSKP